MKFKRIFLPSIVLGGAALLIGPPLTSEGYSLIGGNLSQSQRDFRIHNNFTDASANNNTTPDSQFPGHQGAVMALWKACIEWGSELHGTGGGDPLQPGGLGSTNANFDPAFAGEADGVGGANHNIISELPATDTGVYAYCETPISDGWRIRFYANWNWSDGPGAALFSQKDLQGVGCHEYGHALGLGHSTVSGATMTAGTFSGNEQRTTNFDDWAGVQAIYGAKAATKPRITSVTASGSTLTIVGSNFSATGNEVWFTNQTVTSDTVGDPLVKATGVASTSTILISVSIPGLAGPGDVLVKKVGTGHSSLSNAFPSNGTGAGPTGPTISSITPSTVEAVTVGSDQTVTINGSEFTSDMIVSVDGTPLFGIPSPYSFVDSGTITFDAPLPDALGSVDVTVSNSIGSDTAQLTYVANASPALEAGSGDEPVTFFGTVQLTMGGTPGALFILGFSMDDIPSVLPGLVSLDIGNGFTTLIQLGAPFPIGAAGSTTITVPGAGLPPLTTFFLQGATVEPIPVLPLPASNKQELQFLF